VRTGIRGRTGATPGMRDDGIVTYDGYTAHPRSRATRVGRAARIARDRLADTLAHLPPEATAELRAATARLRRARTPRHALELFEQEVVVLFERVTPLAIAHPLPVTTPARARNSVAVVAAAAAAVEELEAITLLIPGAQPAAAPGFTAVAASAFAAMMVEAYIAASLRVHMVHAAGGYLSPADITRDTLRAMTGRDDVRLTKLAAQTLARRMLHRWSRGVVPIVGMGWAAWDAQKTMREIERMPVRTVSVSSRPVDPVTPVEPTAPAALPPPPAPTDLAPVQESRDAAVGGWPADRPRRKPLRVPLRVPSRRRA